MDNKFSFLTAARWTLLFLVLTPFIVDKSVFFPFIEGKIVFLRAVATAGLVLLALFFVFGKKIDREEFFANKIRMLKNSFTLLIFLFLFLAGISTLFAKDSFRAFFGTVERGEGFIGLVFFTLIFFLALLLFEEREWRWFFGAVAATGIAFLLHQLSQLAQANWQLSTRPFAGFGNPSLLAGYYLFVIFSALAFLVLGSRTSVRKFDFRIWVLSAAAIMASFLGIFLTQTRGTYLGLAAGLGAAGLYLIWHFLMQGKKPALKVIIPGLLLVILIIGIVLAALFFVRSSSFWGGEGQGSGLQNYLIRRFTEAGAYQTRFIAAKVSLRSIAPGNEGWRRFLFGWGQDNYNIAYNTYFDPNYFKYEEVWFDRAHNKVLDVLVMQGFLELLIFLGIWGLVVLFALRFNTKKSDLAAGVGLPKYLLSATVLFFAVAYFVHDLFLFDSPATSVALFMFFAFVVYQSRNRSEQYAAQQRKTVVMLTPVFLSGAFLFIFLFAWTTWLPYLQMKKYIALKTGNLTIKEFTEKLDEVLQPYNYVQERIRIDLLKSLPDLKPEEGIGQLAAKTFEAVDELIEREPYEPRHSMNMAQTLEAVAGRPEFYQKAEEYYRKALALAPNRPDLLYLLSQNLVVQGKMQEAEEPLTALLELSKEIPKAGVLYGAALVYAPEEYRDRSFAVLEHALRTPGAMSRLGSSLPVMRMIYNDFLAEFVKSKDEKKFLTALETAIRVEEEWEKSQEEQFKQGKIKELPWPDESQKTSVLYKRVQEAFPKYGWSVVDVKE